MSNQTKSVEEKKKNLDKAYSVFQKRMGVLKKIVEKIKDKARKEK